MTDTAAPAIGISLQVKVDNRRDLVFQTHIAQESSLEQINGLIDKVAAAADRQSARYELQQIEMELELNTKRLPRAVEDLESVDKKHAQDWAGRQRRGDPKLAPQQEQERRNAIAMIERIKQEIDALGKKREEYKQKIAA